MRCRLTFLSRSLAACQLSARSHSNVMTTTPPLTQAVMLRLAWHPSSRRRRLVTVEYLSTLLSDTLSKCGFTADSVEPPLHVEFDSSTASAVATLPSEEAADAVMRGLDGVEQTEVPGLRLQIRRLADHIAARDEFTPVATPTPPKSVTVDELPGIPGLVLVRDFITEEQEAALLAEADSDRDGE
jgi:hypothetical protein